MSKKLLHNLMILSIVQHSCSRRRRPSREKRETREGTRGVSLSRNPFFKALVEMSSVAQVLQVMGGLTGTWASLLYVYTYMETYVDVHIDVCMRTHIRTYTTTHIRIFPWGEQVLEKMEGLVGISGLQGEVFLPHDGLRPFHQTTTCLMQITSGPYVVQIWSRYPPIFKGNETLEVHRLESGEFIQF